MNNANPERKQALPFAVAVGFAVLGGLGLWFFGAPTQEILDRETPPIAAANGTLLPVADAERAREIAERYVQAVRSGNCEVVISLTWWMQERLHVVQSTAEQPATAVAEERRALCSEIQAASGDDDAVLRAEGIEDRRLLTPTARVEIEKVTAGREDLAKPAIAQVWMRVEYPASGGAPHNEAGRPVKALRIGVNISDEGYVLKSGVIGNLEVDYDSIAYHW